MTAFNTYEDYRNLPECITDYHKLREVAKNGDKETITVESKDIKVVRLYKVTGSGALSRIDHFYVSPETCLAQAHMYCYDNIREHAKSVANLPGVKEDYLHMRGVFISPPSGFGHITIRDETLYYVENFQKHIRLREQPSIFVTVYKDWLIKDNQWEDIDALADMGMTENRCNKHLVFTTKESAEKYLEWHKANTETPIFDAWYDNYDCYADDCYDDETEFK